MDGIKYQAFTFWAWPLEETRKVVMQDEKNRIEQRIKEINGQLNQLNQARSEIQEKQNELLQERLRYEGEYRQVSRWMAEENGQGATVKDLVEK